MPAPPARMRSATVPCGTSSASAPPSRKTRSASFGCEGCGAAVNEAITFRTRPASTRSAIVTRPSSSSSGRFTVVEIMTRSVAPCSQSACIRFQGTPAWKPATRIEAPSGMSATASAAES